MPPGPSPGEVFAGRYRVEKLLGRGGFGQVFRAFDQTLEESVALKTLESSDRDRDLERFRREVRLARRITHANVARTYDIGEHEGIHYLTMELLDGQSLRALLRARKRIAETEVIGVASQICDGLTAAHVAGVVHRDLKPENVFLEKTGRVVVLDFGVARSFLEPGMNSMAIGTPAYMAPEQLGRDGIDGRTDLYALGIILHELISGRLPKWGPTGASDLLARLDAPRATLELAGVAPELESLIGRMLNQDPAARPGSSREAGAVLRSIGGSLVTHASHGDRTEVRAPSVNFGPVPSEGRLVGVLPFKERGANPTEIGETLAEELVDVLSRVRSLRVLASRATARFGADADPVAVGRELGADLMIDGTLQRRGETIRVTARMVEVSSALQIYNQRFEERFEDFLAFEERIAQQIAEALRLELTLSQDRGHASAESVELYLAGRKKLRSLHLWGGENALELLDKVTQSSPNFRPALAAVALARVRRSYARLGHEELDSREAVEASVRRALELAGDLPESHVAAALFAAQYGDFVGAVRHLRTGVTIAPTSAEAQEALGVLQTEAGKSDEGARRLEAAMMLDPQLQVGVASLARHHYFRGDMPQYQAVLEELERRSSKRGPILMQLRLRVLAWEAKREEMQQAIADSRSDPFIGRDLVVAYVAVASGQPLSEPDPIQRFAEMNPLPRFAAFIHQLATEAFALRGDIERAHAHLQAGLDSAMADVAWVECCPALGALRERPEYSDILALLRQRTAVIWSE